MQTSGPSTSQPTPARHLPQEAPQNSWHVPSSTRHATAVITYVPHTLLVACYLQARASLRPLFL